MILVRALYFRKIANLILDCIFKNYSNKFKELGIFKDNQGNKFSFFICASPINIIEPKKITSIIDFLMLIKEETSEIIHLNFILGGIEIPKENLINNQQIEESKEKENNDEEVHPSQGRFLNQFIVSINVIVNYLLNENKDNDIINKYINLIDPKDIVLTKDVDDRINEIMDNIIQKEKEKNDETAHEFVQKKNLNFFQEKNQLIDSNSNKDEEEKNPENEFSQKIGLLDLIEEEDDRKDYKNYIEDIEIVLKYFDYHDKNI